MLPPYEEKMKKTMNIINCVLALFLFLTSCSLKDDNQAGVSITGNTGKISGIIVLESSKNLSRRGSVSLNYWDSVEVVLGHESDTGWVVESSNADSSGRFEFDQLEEATYNLEATLPTGERIQKAGIVLKQGEALDVELRQGTSLGSSGFEVWDVEIQTDPDSAANSLYKGCAFQGSSSPFPFVDVRLRNVNRWVAEPALSEPALSKRTLVASWAIGYTGLYSAAVSIHRPSGSNSQILMIGLCMDSLPERRLEITKTGKDYSCTLLDPVDSVHVACRAGQLTNPEVKARDEVLDRLGTLPRDFSKYFEDSLGYGIIINPQIGLSSNDVVQQLIAVKETLESPDTSTIESDTSIQHPYSPDIPPATPSPSSSLVEKISLEELRALLADTLWDGWYVGSTLNSTEYWGDVKGTFVDITKQPFDDLWIPFESTLAPKYQGADPADAWISMNHPGYEANHDIKNIRMAGDYAVISTQGTCSAYEAHFLFKKDSSGTYRHLGNWPIVTDDQCELMKQFR